MFYWPFKRYSIPEKRWPFTLLQFLDHGIGAMSRPHTHWRKSLQDGVAEKCCWGCPSFERKNGTQLEETKRVVGLVFI
jgi:hypothetical protein